MSIWLTVDKFLLSCVEWVIGFCEVNFAWSAKWMERVVLIIYFIGFVVHALMPPTNFMSCINIVIVGICMRLQHRIPSRTRVLLRSHPTITTMRLIVFLLAVGECLRFIVQSFTWETFMAAFISIGLCISLYWISVPWDDEGRRKRHSKLSLARAVDLFGTSWIEQPVGAH